MRRIGTESLQVFYGYGVVAGVNRLVSHIDMFSSMAELVGQTMKLNAGVDSKNYLSASTGTWKYITPDKGGAFMKLTQTETGNAPVDQLYNLQKDRGEKNNVAEQNPEMVKKLKAILNLEKKKANH